MDKLTWPGVWAWLVGTVGGLLLSVSDAVWLLILMMALDYVSGFLLAVRRKSVSSDVGLVGLKKKGHILLLVMAAHAITHFQPIGIDLGTIVAMAFVVNELISLTENAGRAGVPIPKPLLDYLEKFKKVTQWEGPERRAGTDHGYIGPERRGNGSPAP